MIHNRLTDVSKLGHVLIDGKFVRIKPGDVGSVASYADLKLTVSNDDLAWDLTVRCYIRGDVLTSGDVVVHCWLTRSADLRSTCGLSLLVGGVRLVESPAIVATSEIGRASCRERV